jgi:hypothetical protein
MAAEERLRSWCDAVAVAVAAVAAVAAGPALAPVGRFGLDRSCGTDVRSLLTPDEVLLG